MNREIVSLLLILSAAEATEPITSKTVSNQPNVTLSSASQQFKCCTSSGSAVYYGPDIDCSIEGWTFANCTNQEPCQYASCRSSAAARYIGGCYNESAWPGFVISLIGEGYSCTSDGRSKHTIGSNTIALLTVFIVIAFFH